MADLLLPEGMRDHRRGNPEARVTLVEYGDYECPACGRAFPVIKEIVAQLGGEVCAVFRHYPLSQLHPAAEQAAAVAEAAGAQGRFWEMHDALFQHQSALSLPELLGHARRLGLDAERISAELASGLHAARIREDAMGGLRSGVTGTPAYFINGQRYGGPAELGPLLAALRVAG